VEKERAAIGRKHRERTPETKDFDDHSVHQRGNVQGSEGHQSAMERLDGVDILVNNVGSFVALSGRDFRPNRVQTFVRQSAVKLFCFGRTCQGCRRRIAPGDELSDFVEIARANEALVRDGAIAQFLCGEFFLLEF